MEKNTHNVHLSDISHITHSCRRSSSARTLDVKLPPSWRGCTNTLHHARRRPFAGLRWIWKRLPSGASSRLLVRFELQCALWHRRQIGAPCAAHAPHVHDALAECNWCNSAPEHQSQELCERKARTTEHGEYIIQ